MRIEAYLGIVIEVNYQTSFSNVLTAGMKVQMIEGTYHDKNGQIKFLQITNDQRIEMICNEVSDISINELNVGMYIAFMKVDGMAYQSYKTYPYSKDYFNLAQVRAEWQNDLRNHYGVEMIYKNLI